jgi:subtilisin family serine protease
METYESTNGEIRLPSIYSEEEMKDFEMRLRRASPEKTANLLEEFAIEFGLDLDASAVKLLSLKERSIKLGESEFIPPEGIESKLSSVVNEAQLGEYIAAVLQLDQEPSLRELIELSRLGVKGLFNRIAPATCIVGFPTNNFSKLSEFPSRRWLGYYGSEYKIVAEYEWFSTAFVAPIDCDRPEYVAQMEELGIWVFSYDSDINKYYVDISPSEAGFLAELWWVKTIGFMPLVEPQVVQENEIHKKFLPQDSRGLCSAFAIWSHRTGVGITLGAYDTSPWRYHADFPSGTFAPGSDNGSGSHGTHVGGIIAARDSTSINVSGQYDCQGMAPGAQLYFVDLYAHDYATAFSRFESNDIRASNHSWGFTYDPYSYDSRTQNIDSYADDKDMTIVIAAGNDGLGSGTITNPGTGKNVITVGAIRYVTDDDRSSREIGGTAEYSSCGPSQGRLKPDLVAPGGQTLYDYGYYKYGVVSLDENPSSNIGSDAWPESSQYVRMSGTSMATPHVTGTVGLMLDNATASGYSIDNEGIKAMLLATTIPLDDGGSIPSSGYASNSVGYGLLNAYNATRWYYTGESGQLKWAGGTLNYWTRDHEWTFNVPSGTKRLIAVLSYDDQEGGGGALIDDLDLDLDDGLVCIGYLPPSGVTEESPVEKIIVEDPRSGNWTARISFKNPGVLSTQDYSLYVYALYKKPSLLITSVSVPSGDLEPGESFNVSVTVQNSGGWIAAGVTAKVSGSAFGSQAGWTKYVGNLMYEGASATISSELTAPTSPGTHTLTIAVDGVNRCISPRQTQRTITVASDPALCKDTSSLDFGTSSTSKTFEVWNCGGGTLSYTISDDRTWISVSPTSGSSTGEHDTITVTVNRSGLSPGHYTGTVTIDPNYGANQYVSIAMDVP